MLRIPSRYRRFCVILAHTAAILVSLTLAFLLRFEFLVPRSETGHLTRGLCIAIVIKTLIFRFESIDSGGWRYASIIELRRILRANFFASIAFVVVTALTIGVNFPRSVYCIDFLLCFFLTAGARFAFRLYREGRSQSQDTTKKRRVLIYGAGSAGLILQREILENPSLRYRVAGFLDDAPSKQNIHLRGVPVLGNGRRAATIVARYRKRRQPIEAILIAMPSATGRQMQEAIANCRMAGVLCKTVPGVGELISGHVLIRQIRDVSVLDLLGRNPVHLDEETVRKFLRGKSVMVTGAAGSIGSELCRQIARFAPEYLVAFEQAESELFRITNEITARYPSLSFVPALGDIRDVMRVQEVIRRYGVDCIFHAAAYKHVPMIESHALEAIKNNVLGSRNLVEAAYANKVSHCLMISSDKAVNPTNIMGLTKRISELILSSMPVPREESGTKFVAVRFGNVLGSNGSVVPVFKQQIEAGGPVTVTHPDMKRYFMTIGEAVELVLQASTMGKGSEIFVLDMGEPVRIADLARNMIRLSGREPEVDIEIRYVGLRPGEKLAEEIMRPGEDVMPTYHEKINIFRGPSADRMQIDSVMRELELLVSRNDAEGAVRLLWSLAPEYTPDGKWREALVGTRLRAAVARA